MSDGNVPSGETYPHKIAAEYASQAEADNAVSSLLDDVELSPAQIRAVCLHHVDMARRLCRESSGLA